jgi:hypothetical protein
VREIVCIELTEQRERAETIGVDHGYSVTVTSIEPAERYRSVSR